jgi:hypothetical protein
MLERLSHDNKESNEELSQNNFYIDCIVFDNINEYLSSSFIAFENI